MTKKIFPKFFSFWKKLFFYNKLRIEVKIFPTRYIYEFSRETLKFVLKKIYS